MRATLQGMVNKSDAATADQHRVQLGGHGAVLGSEGREASTHISLFVVLRAQFASHSLVACVLRERKGAGMECADRQGGG